MSDIIIGLNSEYYGISTYDVFVSTCDPTNWQIVANDISFSDFPVNVNLNDYSITGSCYQYYVSGDTGCYCSATGSTTPQPSPSVTPTVTVTPSVTPTISITPSVTPTISITPSMTPTPSCAAEEVNFEAITGSSTPTLALELFNGYIRTDGSNPYHSICDGIGCGSNFSLVGKTFTGGTYSPSTGLSETLTASTRVLKSDCTQWTNTDFFNASNWKDNQSQTEGDLYGAVTGSNGTTIYKISNSGGYMVYNLHATCDYTGNTEGITGFDVQLNNSGQWVINGIVEPDITLECGVEYHFHICSSGSSTTFWFADYYDDNATQHPNDAALTSSDGVDNNGTYDSTIIVNLSASGTTGGYYYGTGDEFGASGRIFTTGC